MRDHPPAISAEQSNLEAAKATFFTSGGTVQSIPVGVGSWNLSLLPVREEVPRVKVARPRRNDQSVEQRRKREVLVGAIRHCIEVERMTQMETVAAVGVCRNKVVAIVNEFGIKYSRKKVGS